MAGVIGVIVWYSRLLGQYWLRGDTLLMGFALAQAQRWLGKRREDLSDIDQDFINQSGAQQRAIGLRFAILFMFVTSWTILINRTGGICLIFCSGRPPFLPSQLRMSGCSTSAPLGLGPSRVRDALRTFVPDGINEYAP